MKTLVKNFIGRKWVGAHSGRTFDSRDPATGEVVGRCVDSGPVGVVGLITPWNFPIAIPSWKTFPALILGNTVVLKPSPETPVTASLFVQVLEECGVPPGVVNLVLGSSPELGAALVRHSNVALISFTGSTATGDQVAMDAAAGHKRVALEMGGKNAILVMDDADLDLAVDGITWSAFGTTGQRCTACSRLLVHREAKERLTRMLLNRMAKLTVGNGLKPGVEIGPLVNHAQLERVQRYIQVGMQEGARLLTGGKALTDGEYARGHFFAPTLFDQVKPTMRIAQEEIFGPVLGVIEVKDLEEAIAVNNSVEYGLSTALYTRDLNRAQRAMRDLRTAIVYINAGTIGSEVHLPFGGMRRTGNGHRQEGEAALD